MEKIKTPEMDKLFRAILSLGSVEECYEFFTDVCTIKELKELTSRFTVACLLDQGKIYTEICKKTGASTATISRVNRCLQYGTDGYKKAIKRINSEEELNNDNE